MPRDNAEKCEEKLKMGMIPEERKKVCIAKGPEVEKHRSRGD